MNVSWLPCPSPYFFFGTFAPFLRAFDSPIAIACFRLLILCLPDFLWCISVRTSWLAFLLYLRRDFFLAGILSPLSFETLAEASRVAPAAAGDAPEQASRRF